MSKICFFSGGRGGVGLPREAVPNDASSLLALAFFFHTEMNCECRPLRLEDVYLPKSSSSRVSFKWFDLQIHDPPPPRNLTKKRLPDLMFLQHGRE